MGLARQRLAHHCDNALGSFGLGNVPEEAGGPGQWLVIYFTATKFTNAGISVLSRTKEGNPAAVMKEILESLADIENEAVKKLAREIFEVLRN